MNADRTYYSDLFKKIANEQKVLLNNHASEQGITYVQSLVILFLLNTQSRFGNEHEVSQKDVERYLSLKSSTVTHILSRMEDNGLIVRMKSEKDCRANLIYPTKRGEAIVPLFFNALEDVESIMTKGMTKDEENQLQHLLGKVLANLEENKG